MLISSSSLNASNAIVIRFLPISVTVSHLTTKRILFLQNLTTPSPLEAARKEREVVSHTHLRTRQNEQTYIAHRLTVVEIILFCVLIPYNLLYPVVTSYPCRSDTMIVQVVMVFPFEAHHRFR